MIFVTGELPYLTNFNFSIIDIVWYRGSQTYRMYFGVWLAAVRAALFPTYGALTAASPEIPCVPATGIAHEEPKHNTDLHRS